MERECAEELDASTEVKVYAKPPRGFSIPAPVENYNPDWAIAFDAGKVRHIYFIAETKITSSEVKYDVVSSYEKLMELVN